MRILLIFFIILPYSLFGFNLESYRIHKSSVSVFHDVSPVEQGDGLRFVLNSNKDESIVVNYYEGDVLVNSFEEELLSGVTHFIPSKNKSIILSGNSKKYTFEFSTVNTKKTVSVLMNILSDGLNFYSLNKEGVFEINDNVSQVFKNKPAIYSSVINSLYAENQNFFQNHIEYKEETTRASASMLFQKVAPSVVMIQTEDGLGSGTIIDNEGTILTNFHVIEGNDLVNVYFKPARYSNVSMNEAHLADVIKYDTAKDLALIKLRKVNHDLVPVDFENFNEIDVAQKVHAIGHPHGEQWTYSQGFVSQIRKDYKWEAGSYKNIADIVQTQTPINPGNSGGPLLSDDGKIIGVNSFVDKSGQGLNYAVAVSSVRSFLLSKDKFKRSEEISNASSDEGLEGQILDLDDDGVAESLGYDTNKDGRSDIILTDYLEDIDSFLTAYIDSNYDGNIDRVRKTEKYEGSYYWLTSVDLDEDGKEDVYELDFDMDGKVDKRILADEE